MNKNPLNITTGITLNSTYFADYALDIFTNSFDNFYTAPFAVILGLWGSLFSEYMRRQESKLSYEWDTENLDKQELDRVEYSKALQEYRNKKHDNTAEFPLYHKYLKYLVSLLVTVLAMGLVGLDIGAFILFRVWIRMQLTSYGKAEKLLTGNIGAAMLNAFCMVVLTQIYKRIAEKLTDWENPRTKTEYENNIIIKLFAFEFVNSYGTLFYMAFLRSVTIPGGFFGLGYDDDCGSDSCMSLLTIQISMALLIKPFPRFFSSVIVPFITTFLKRLKKSKNLKNIAEQINEIAIEGGKVREGQLTFQEFQEYIFISTEKNKIELGASIRNEYMEKVLLFGYIMLFSASFTLGPLVLLLVLLFDIRVDAKAYLWTHRRDVAEPVQNIGLHPLLFKYDWNCS